MKLINKIITVGTMGIACGDGDYEIDETGIMRFKSCEVQYYDMYAFSYASFSESIKPYGWTYYKTDVDYQGYSIFYFRKGSSLIGMAWIGYDRVIYGKIR